MQEIGAAEGTRELEERKKGGTLLLSLERERLSSFAWEPSTTTREWMGRVGGGQIPPLQAKKKKDEVSLQERHKMEVSGVGGEATEFSDLLVCPCGR